MTNKNYWIVFNKTIEWSRCGGADEQTSFLIYSDLQSAQARLLVELQENLCEQSILDLRTSFILQVTVPVEMLENRSPRRWISDRISYLLKDCTGYKRYAVSTRLAGKLKAECLRGLKEIEQMLNGKDWDNAVILTMQAAGSIARLSEFSQTSTEIIKSADDFTKKFGEMAWNGEELTSFIPDLKLLINTLTTGKAPVIQHLNDDQDHPSWIDGIIAKVYSLPLPDVNFDQDPAAPTL